MKLLFINEGTFEPQKSLEFGFKYDLGLGILIVLDWNVLDCI